MKKLSLVFAAIIAFAACTKELPNVSITADTEFNDNNIATAILTLSAASDSEVQVLLEGTPGDKLTFSRTVTIPAGTLSANFMVKLNPDGIDPNAPIQIYIKDAIGANVGAPALVTIGLKGYSNSDNPGGGGNEETPGEGNITLVSTWKAEMDGEPYTDEYGDWIDLKMTTTGINYYAVEGITDDVFDAYYDGIEDLIQDYDAYIAGELEDGYTVSQLLFVDGEYTYIEYPGEGAGKIYIIEFDASGKATGRYGATAATFPEFEGSGSGGGELDWEKTTVGVPATFTKNTSLGVEYLGRYTDGDDTGDLFSATGTGEAMWAIDVFAPNDFDGDVHAYAADLAAYIEQGLADLVEEYGADLVSYFYEDFADFLAYEVLGTYEGEEFYFDPYDNGTYDALVLTFTADGDLTGEYNLVKVVVDGHEYVEEDSDISSDPDPVLSRRHFAPGSHFNPSASRVISAKRSAAQKRMTFTSHFSRR
ncbi:MAG: hypothetical protein J6X25_06315 [Bacteroidales bacterium]|nr:hypothetical protein [Bacteroidales bacterium]